MRYLPRFKRAAVKAPPLRLQPRDIEILKLVNEFRFLNTRHIQILAPGSNQVILRRLQKLFHNGYLDRVSTSLYEKTVYALGNNGADVLTLHTGVDRGKIDWVKKNREVRNPFINHTLMIADFRISLSLALADTDIKLSLWVPEGDDLRDEVMIWENGSKTKFPFYPDGYFVLEDQGKYLNFFLEADQSTMTNERFLKKLKGYWSFYTEGKHRLKFGIESFRVLTVTKTNARAENLMRTSKKVDDGQVGSLMFWFASEDNYSPEEPEAVLREIWQIPGSEGRRSLI